MSKYETKEGLMAKFLQELVKNLLYWFVYLYPLHAQRTARRLFLLVNPRSCAFERRAASIQIPL